MSTLSLPGYTVDPTLQTPTYSAEPQLHETTLSRGRPSSGAFVILSPPPPPFATAEFVKESKRGSLRLRLSGQASDNIVVPVFSTRGPVEGTLELLKPPGHDLAYVAIRVSFLSLSAFLRIELTNLIFSFISILFSSNNPFKKKKFIEKKIEIGMEPGRGLAQGEGACGSRDDDDDGLRRDAHALEQGRRRVAMSVQSPVQHRPTDDVQRRAWLVGVWSPSPCRVVGCTNPAALIDWVFARIHTHVRAS
jgi:hypothetical protein